MGDGLDEGDHGADQDHEHDRVLDLHPGVQLQEGVPESLAQDGPVEEAAGLGHAAGDGRFGRLVVGVAVVVIRRTFRG